MGTNKRSMFLSEYLKDFNATQAAIRAGYSPKSARAIASAILTKVDIQEEIKAEITERSMGKDEILTRLADMARGDIADLMALSTMGFTFELMIPDPETGEMVPNPKTKLIRKIKQKVTTYSARAPGGDDREIVETELELYDAKDALVQLAKLQGMFTEHVDMTSGGQPNQTR